MEEVICGEVVKQSTNVLLLAPRVAFLSGAIGSRVCINSEVPRPDGHASKKGPPGRGALIGEKDRAGSKLNLQVGHSPTDDRRTEGKKRSVVVQLL